MRAVISCFRLDGTSAFTCKAHHVCIYFALNIFALYADWNGTRFAKLVLNMWMNVYKCKIGTYVCGIDWKELDICFTLIRHTASHMWCVSVIIYKRTALQKMLMAQCKPRAFVLRRTQSELFQWVFLTRALIMFHRIKDTNPYRKCFNTCGWY